jgi:hypothetical protein
MRIECPKCGRREQVTWNGCNDVPFTEISRQRFVELNDPNGCEGLWPREHEHAWFACDSEQVLGVLLMDPHTLRWSYMICAKAEAGGYKRVGLGAEIPGERLARRAIAGEIDGYRSCWPVPD